ncbi:hypothetical protein Q7P37_009755 [Cladosporium fusiforme]
MRAIAKRHHYETLDVEPGVAGRDLRYAYIRACFRAHPDHGGTHSEMLAVNAAWDALNSGNIDVISGEDISDLYGDEREFFWDSESASDWDSDNDEDHDIYYDYGDLNEQGGSYVVQLEDGKEVSVEEHARTCTCDVG